MKKVIFTLLFAFSFMFVGSISAQSYSSSVGVKLGWGFSGSFKKQLKESMYVDLYAGFFGAGGFFGGAAVEFHKPIEDVENLYWYYGGGAFISTYSYGIVTRETNMSFGINGVLGLDYAFTEIPLNISADWMPGFTFGSYSGFSGYGGGLTARYILSEN